MAHGRSPGTPQLTPHIAASRHPVIITLGRNKKGFKAMFTCWILMQILFQNLHQNWIEFQNSTIDFSGKSIHCTDFFPPWIQNQRCGKKSDLSHLFNMESCQILLRAAKMQMSPIEMGLIYIQNGAAAKRNMQQKSKGLTSDYCRRFLLGYAFQAEKSKLRLHRNWPDM